MVIMLKKESLNQPTQICPPYKNLIFDKGKNIIQWKKGNF